MPSLLARLLVYCAALSACFGYGKDFGEYGQTFPISEENFLEYLLREFERKSPEEIQALQEKVSQEIKDNLTRPSRVQGLQVCSEERSFLYDPTVTLNKSLFDTNGQVVVAAGTRVNPLDTVSLPQEMIFFDAEDKQQLDWAHKNKSAKWILIGGSPLELEEEEGRPVFFDQYGVLCKKLGIQQIPAVVTQEGRMLRVSEVICDTEE